jgi:hypothetical protein
MQKNKNTILAIVGLVIIAVIVLMVVKNNKKPVEVTEIPTDSVEQVDDTTTEVGAVVIKPKTNSISYQQALVKYKDHRIQLGQDCQATPTSVTYKNGTSIMIDNRSNVARTVKVGSNYTINAWSFKVVNLTSSTLPATWLVDCGKQQNVATILIQK